jgi:hypothetical protein
MTTTIELVRNRFRTLDSACEHIEKLEAQIVALNAALTAGKSAAPAKAQTPTAPPNAPSANQPAPAATTPAAKSLDDMSLRELADAADTAAVAGNKAEANRFYRAYSERKANC